MSTFELRASEVFKTKLGEKEAETVIEYFESKADQKKDVLLTKDDKMELISRIEATTSELVARVKSNMME